MWKIDLTEAQILESLAGLSPRGRQEALRRLLTQVEELDQLVDRNRLRIEKLARERGVDWESLSDEERQRFVDQILHEA